MLVKIFQLDLENPGTFRPYHDNPALQGEGFEKNYNLVFNGELDASTLDHVFTILNTCTPKGYTGRTLSVSDIVGIYNDKSWNKGWTYHFCDSIGWKDIDFKDATIDTNSIMEFLRGGK